MLKVELELTNGKKHTVEWTENERALVDKVSFEERNGVFQTTEGTYICINKIVEFKVQN